MGEKSRLLAWIVPRPGRYEACFVAEDAPEREPTCLFSPTEWEAREWVMAEAEELGASVVWCSKDRS